MEKIVPIIACIGLWFCALGSAGSAFAQPYLGFRVGSGMNTVRYQETDFLSDRNYRQRPFIGYMGGMALHYKVKDHWVARIDLDYAERGRVVEVDGTFYARDELRNRHIDASILFQRMFGGRRVRAHIGIGPILSGWIGTRGEFSSALVHIYTKNRIRHYKLDVNPLSLLASNGDPQQPDLTQDAPKLLLYKIGTFQWGLTLGTGLIVPLDNQKRLLIDARYMYMQTHWAQNEDDFDEVASGFLSGLHPNYETAYQGFNISIGLVFGIGVSVFGP